MIFGYLIFFIVLIGYVYIDTRNRKQEIAIDLFKEELRITVTSLACDEESAESSIERIMTVLNGRPSINIFERKLYRELIPSLKQFQITLASMNKEKNADLIYSAFLYENLVKAELRKL